MTLKRLALITTTLLITSAGFGCSSHSKTDPTNDVVRFWSRGFGSKPVRHGHWRHAGSIDLHKTQPELITSFPCGQFS